MTLKISFDLDDQDLQYFRASIEKAQRKSSKLSEDTILSAAEVMINSLKSTKVADFVQHRIGQLATLIAMLRDSEWALEVEERSNVLATLAYFCEPHDIIPDSVPVLGLIDDAIMIELVVRELKHEFDAYSDFCRYRDNEKARKRNLSLSRAEYLQIKRRELHSRMRRRRKNSLGSDTSSRPRFRLF